jgi:O-antigen ligase
MSTAINPIRDTATPWERMIYWGLVGLLFWAPLPFGSNRPWAVAIVVVWVALLGAAWSMGWMLGKCNVRSSFYRGRLLFVVLCAWAALVSVQLVPLPAQWVALISPGAAAVHGAPYGGVVVDAITFSIDPSATARYQLLTLALVGYFALMLLVIQRTERLKHFALMLVLSGVMCSVLALYLHFVEAYYVLFFETVDHLVAKGPFINRNHLAAYLEICLACGVGLIVSEFSTTQLATWKQRARWLLRLLLSSKVRVRLLLIVMVIALILTRSRMGNAAFFVALIASGLIALLCLKVGWKTILFFLGSMIILDVVVIGSWIGVEHVVKRMQQTAISSETKTVQGFQEQSVEERTDQGVSALESVKAFPLLGVGSGAFESMYPQYKQPGYMMSLDHAHNDYVEFLVEAGPLGMLLLAALFATLLMRCVLTMARSHRATQRGLALGSVIGLMAIAIHLTVEFALQIPAVALAFVALMAIGACAAQAQVALPPNHDSKRNGSGTDED